MAVSPKEDFQTLKDYFELQNTLPSQWGSYAGPAGIGQYSLVKKVPVGVFARFDIHFRKPSVEEMHADINYWGGEQTIGPAVDEIPEDEKKWKNNSKVKFFEKDHYFMAPDRFRKMMFLSRVFEDNLPKYLTSLIEEVDSISVKNNPEIIHQSYHFMHAIDGKIKYAAFRDPKKFNESLLTNYGFVERNNEKLIFYPKGDKQNSIDFTSAIIE